MKKETESEKQIIDILKDFNLGYTPNSGRKGMRHWANKIRDIISQEKKKLLDEMEKRIPNVESINPSYFRDVIRIFRDKIKN